VLDCVALCAIAGIDITKTTSDPRMAADSFVDFGRLFFNTPVRKYASALPQPNLCKVAQWCNNLLPASV
jgi:hypothetical protein